jgi:hypothetical protein
MTVSIGGGLSSGMVSSLDTVDESSVVVVGDIAFLAFDRVQDAPFIPANSRISSSVIPMCQPMVLLLLC